MTDSRTAHQVPRILAALAGPEPLTARQVAERIYVSESSARKYLRGLPGRVYVAAWIVHAAGRHTPRYLAGNLPDVPSPRALTRTERTAKRWAAIKACPLRHEIMLEKLRKPKPAPAEVPALNWRQP